MARGGSEWRPVLRFPKRQTTQLSCGALLFQSDSLLHGANATLSAERAAAI